MTSTSITLRFALLLSLTNGFLDAHTYLARGGVFANVQTANVIFAAIDLSTRRVGSAVAHLCPIVAFLAGVLVCAHMKSGHLDKFLPHPLRWAMGIQAAVLAIIGFVPPSVPHSYVTVPISFVAAMQMYLFRSIGELPYLPVATSGNLMRMMEAGYMVIVEKDTRARSVGAAYGGLAAAFTCGAIIGAIATHVWGVHAIWIQAGFLALTLAFFLVDERKGTAP